MENKKLIINKDYDPIILQTILKRYWWWPVFFVTLFVTLAFLSIRYTKPTYSSSTVIQLASQDQAKEVIGQENINSRQTDIYAEVELIKSQLIFEKAIQKIPYNVSLYSKGQILTEERYRSSSFNIQPFALRDSSLIGVPITVTCDDGVVSLKYELNGRRYAVNGKVNSEIKNKHFDILFKAGSPVDF